MRVFPRIHFPASDGGRGSTRFGACWKSGAGMVRMEDRHVCGGCGAKATVESQIASIGDNVIMIFSGSVMRSGMSSGYGGAGKLTLDDVESIQRAGRGHPAAVSHRGHHAQPRRRNPRH